MTEGKGAHGGGGGSVGVGLKEVGFLWGLRVLAGSEAGEEPGESPREALFHAAAFRLPEGPLEEGALP